jgi:DNA primase
MRSREEFREVMASLDMEEWLSHEGVEYRNTRGTKGEQLNIQTCPSCGKDEWKVYLNAETGLGNCFSGSCPKGTFNKYSFIREYLLNCNRRINVIDHIKQFVTEMGWRPKRIFSVSVEMESKELKLPEYEFLPINGKNLKYLANRRVDIETAQYFNLGYIREGYFGKRILIPIHNLGGELISFQARDITGLAEKKYLFPKGFASTGSVLYNGQNAIGKKRAVLVEGAFDAISTKVAFDEDRELRDIAIIGSFGMNLSGNTNAGENDQLSRFIELKEAGLQSVAIMWDGESKAVIKAVAAGIVLKKLGLIVHIVILPKDRDPSDVAPETLRKCYRQARLLNQEFALQVKLRRGEFYL